TASSFVPRIPPPALKSMVNGKVSGSRGKGRWRRWCLAVGAGGRTGCAGLIGSFANSADPLAGYI
ncbi:unnamed protein product, partial [Urochloa humidicola]